MVYQFIKMKFLLFLLFFLFFYNSFMITLNTYISSDLEISLNDLVLPFEIGKIYYSKFIYFLPALALAKASASFLASATYNSNS